MRQKTIAVALACLLALSTTFVTALAETPVDGGPSTTVTEGDKTPGEGDKAPGEGDKAPGEGDKAPGEGDKAPAIAGGATPRATSNAIAPLAEIGDGMIHLNSSGAYRDDNNGLTPETAVHSLAAAVERAKENNINTIMVHYQVLIDGGENVTLDGLTFVRDSALDGQHMFAIGYVGGPAELTLKNTTLDGNHVPMTEYMNAMILVNAGSTLNIENGTKIINENGHGAIDANEGATINMNGGEISNNYSRETGGAIYLNNAILNLNGGEIFGNRSDEAGGAICSLGGAIKLDGTTIRDNTAAYRGGAIHMAPDINDASLVMTKGKITGNNSGDGYAHNLGGAISAWSDSEDGAVISISGGEISGNMVDGKEDAKGSAILLTGDGPYAKLKLSNSPEIRGNVYLDGLTTESPIIKMEADCAPKNRIHVGAAYPIVGVTAVRYAGTANIDDFVSDEEPVALIRNRTTTDLVWGSAIKVTFKYDGKEEYRYVAPGGTIDPDETAGFENPGYHISGWQTENGAKWDFNTSVTDPVTLVPVWDKGSDGNSSGGKHSGGSSGSNSSREEQEEDDFWRQVQNKVQKADEFDTIKVNAGTHDHFPKKLMELLNKKDVNLVISFKGGKTFTIPAGEAQDVTSGRVYWMLAQLEKLYRGAEAVTETTELPASLPGKTIPNTGRL